MAAGDLCTLGDVKSFMQHLKEDNAQKDALKEMMITRASAVITTFAEREFVPTASAARTFTYNGSGVLNLNPYDLRTVTSISLGTQTETPSELGATEYALRPKPSVYGTYKWVEIKSSELEEETEVTINGAWGMATIPVDVVHACVLTVAIWLRQDVYVAPSEWSTGGVANIGLPPSVKQILSPYRGVRIG